MTGTELTIVVDHLSGARRGQRQQFSADRKVRFGRHPDSEVAFDAQRDIDASSRHAELRTAAAEWQLVDVGSSNGTFVDNQRITAIALASATPIVIQFGRGGPKLRVFIGNTPAIRELPAPTLDVLPGRRRRWGVGLGLLAIALILWRMLAL